MNGQPSSQRSEGLHQCKVVVRLHSEQAEVDCGGVSVASVCDRYIVRAVHREAHTHTRILDPHRLKRFRERDRERDSEREREREREIQRERD
jgi:hypothetical protein